MKQLSQKENKRLKGLDEPTNKQIANKKQLDDIMNELYKTSKTYEHNKKILSIKPEHNKKSLIEKLFILIKKIIKFCLKCIIYFIIGYIILIILAIILKAIS